VLYAKTFILLTAHFMAVKQPYTLLDVSASCFIMADTSSQNTVFHYSRNTESLPVIHIAW